MSIKVSYLSSAPDLSGVRVVGVDAALPPEQRPKALGIAELPSLADEVAEKVAERLGVHATVAGGPPPVLIDAAEAARLLGLRTVRALYSLLERQSIPGIVRQGRTLRFHRPTLVGWAERKAAKR